MILLISIPTCMYIYIKMKTDTPTIDFFLQLYPVVPKIMKSFKLTMKISWVMVFPIITTKPSLCQHFHCCYSTAASTQELNSKGNLTELLKSKFYPAIIHTELLHHFLCRHVLYILLLKDTNPISVKGSNSIYLYVPYKSRKNISSLPKHVY